MEIRKVTAHTYKAASIKALRDIRDGNALLVRGAHRAWLWKRGLIQRTIDGKTYELTQFGLEILAYADAKEAPKT